MVPDDLQVASGARLLETRFIPGHRTASIDHVDAHFDGSILTHTFRCDSFFAHILILAELEICIIHRRVHRSMRNLYLHLVLFI